MSDHRAIISAINDEYSLKSRSTIKLLYDWMASDAGEDLGSLVKYLNDVSSDDEHPYQSNSLKILNRLNDADFSEYLDYIDQIDKSETLLVPFYSILYPRELWKIDHPPLCLYVRGDASTLFGGVAIVGTREANDERREFARELASRLASKGYPIVSGLANGIDTMAHRGAIDGGGQTVAVLPGGVKNVRPASNKELAAQIPESGAIVAELSDFANIHRGRFVERNRITSGISLAVVVAASGETGGTIRQSEFAQEQSSPRFLYDPGTNDGQSPEKLSELGFSKFSTIEELESLLNSEWEESRDVELGDFASSSG